MSMGNDIENNEFGQVFHRFKQNTQPATVSDDFENCVFTKIKKKKTQRKVITSVSLGILIFAFLFVAQAVMFQKESKPTIMAQPGTELKEEVPIMEDVIFSSSDSRTNYAIEQVAYYEDDGTI